MCVVFINGQNVLKIAHIGIYHVFLCVDKIYSANVRPEEKRCCQEQKKSISFMYVQK